MTSPRVHGLVGEVDRTEVATADDLASRRADEFLAMALIGQQAKAEGGRAVQAGTCTWCGQRCMARAVYCDADCRADHETEQRRRARQGLA